MYYLVFPVLFLQDRELFSYYTIWYKLVRVLFAQAFHMSASARRVLVSAVVGDPFVGDASLAASMSGKRSARGSALRRRQAMVQ